MNYRKRDGGTVVSEHELKTSFPNTSFPRPLDVATVAAYGYDPILEGSRPATTPPYERVSSTGVQEIDGVYYTKYTVTTATGDDALAIDNKIATSERSRRDQALSDSDYTQIADKAGLTDSKVTEWATYRQALRDLPTASGWPHTHTWPTKPS